MNDNNTSIKEHIYRSLLKDIIEGNYSPDQVLNEKNLMEQYQVSRSPIREALVELCKEKVLYSIPYYGYKITPLTEQDIYNVKTYRCILECGFMSECWHKFTPETLSALEALKNSQLKNGARQEAIRHWNDNIDFHLAFFRIYENDYAYETLRSAMSMQTRAYVQIRMTQQHSPFFEETSVFHKSILEAVKRNDKTTAVSLMRADIMSI